MLYEWATRPSKVRVPAWRGKRNTEDACFMDVEEQKSIATIPTLRTRYSEQIETH
jgi:hypothetical protein